MYLFLEKNILRIPILGIQDDEGEGIKIFALFTSDKKQEHRTLAENFEIAEPKDPRVAFAAVLEGAPLSLAPVLSQAAHLEIEVGGKIFYQTIVKKSDYFFATHFDNKAKEVMTRIFGNLGKLAGI